jgi:predicted RNase H-like nuclease (RuvC/YqgF family)
MAYSSESLQIMGAIYKYVFKNPIRVMANTSSVTNYLRQRVEDQRENIVSLQNALASQDAIHAQRMADMKETYNERVADFRSRLEREEARSNSLQREIRRIRVINTGLAIAIAVVAVVALCVVIDALNGGWGLIRY